MRLSSQVTTDLLSDACNNSEVLREVSCEDAGDAVGIEVL